MTNEQEQFTRNNILTPNFIINKDNIKSLAN